MIPILTAVFNTLWEGLVMTAAVALGLRFCRTTNAATRHILWWCVLTAIVLLPVVPAVFTGAPAALEAVPAAMAGPAPVEPVTFQVPATPAPAAGASSFRVELPGGSWPEWVLAAWCSICLLQLGRTAWSYRFLRGIKRRAHTAAPELRRSFDAWMMSCGVHRPVSLLISDEIGSPMAVGFREPAVVLPERLLNEFDETDLDHVVLHELAHMARRDDWTNLAARIAGALLALHPVAVWVLGRIEREREIACDDWVVAMTGAARPYANSLARLFEMCRAGGPAARPAQALATGMAARASHLGERIELLLRRNGRFAPKASAARVAAGAALLLFAALSVARAPWWIALAQDPPPAPAAPSVPDAPPQAEAPAPPSVPLPPTAPPPSRARAFAAVAAQPATPPPSTPPPAAAPALPQTPPPPASTPPRQPAGFLAALVASGYGNLSVDEIIDLKNAGISAEFLNGMARSGWGHLPSKQLIELSQQGVSPAYAQAMRQAGLRDLTLRDVIDLRLQGARPEVIGEIHALGFGPYSARTAIEFANHGVGPGLFRAFKEAGMTQVTPQEIIEAQNAGLSDHDFREARQYGAHLTLKQIIRLKQAGVI